MGDEKDKGKKENISKFEFEIGDIFEDVYEVISQLGSGGFGVIYEVVDIRNGKRCALKVEIEGKRKVSALSREVAVYNDVRGIIGFPELYEYSLDGKRKYISMELLGPSIGMYFNRYKRVFSIGTVASLGIKMLKLIRELHERGYVHRDIKPENFLTGIENMKKEIYLTDFGLAHKYNVDKKLRQNRKSLVGTSRYVSLNNHLGIFQTRRDDLESLGYVLIMFMRGRLPWQGIKKSLPVNERYEAMYKKKLATSIEELCQDLPEQIEKYMYYTRQMDIDDAPDYEYLENLFYNICRNQGLYPDEVIYEWELENINQKKLCNIFQKRDGKKK